MKKIYTLALGLLGVTALNAQEIMPLTTAKTPVKIQKERSSKGFRGSNTCTDENEAIYWMSTMGAGQATYAGYLMSSDADHLNSFGTYVEAPANTSITISDITLTGASLRPDFANVSVNVRIFEAGADSLPTGPALGAAAVSVDTSFFHTASFNSPVTFSGNVVVIVEADAFAVSDSMVIYATANNVGQLLGAPAVFNIGTITNGAYARLPQYTVGNNLPHLDMSLSFDQSNDFTMSVSKLSGHDETVDFVYEGPSISDNLMWSWSGITGSQTSHWDFDFATGAGRDTSVVFADASIDYNITLTDSIEMFDGGVCVVSETKVLEKAFVTSINDVEANAVNAFVANGNIVLSNATGVATVYSINGSVKAQVLVSNSKEVINASDFTPGIYLVSVNDKVWKLKL